MKQFQSKVAFVLVNLMVINSVAATGAFAATTTSTPVDHTAVLLQDVKTLQSGIDSGVVKSTDAIDTFSQSITDQGLSVDDVDAFVKTQMTTEQYTAFQDKVNSSMRGIDPTTLTSQETGEIVGQALAGIHTEGLYWSGCANVWTGAALIAAAIVTGVFAIIKSKSISSIQSDYQNKITSTQNQYQTDETNTTSNYNNQIQNTNNWQTAFPQLVNQYRAGISNATSTIANDQAQINNLSYQENNANTQAEANSYAQQIQNYTQDIANQTNAIQSDTNNIASYENKIIQYTANPGQAAIDAATLATQRDAAISDLQTQEPIDIANLQSQETSAVAAAPANQSLGQKLGIGAGIGTAIGAGLLIYGIKEGASCGD